MLALGPLFAISNALPLPSLTHLDANCDSLDREWATPP